MERPSRQAYKPVCEKENQHRNVNKRTDILSSLQNIKLPLQPSLFSKDNQFQSVPIISSLVAPTDQPSSARSILLPSEKSEAEITNTEDYCYVYGDSLEALLAEDEHKGRFLSSHKIDSTLRARMLDWMVEVIGSYNFQHKTYFAGVELMDRYFQKSSESLAPSQLHIIGVQSMFIATKMEEVYPLKMRTVFDKIAHKKIPISELVQMEVNITEVLDFSLTTRTFFDLAMAKLAVHLTDSKSYTTTLIKQMEDVCACLSKFLCYNYDIISEFDKPTIANMLFHFVLELFEKQQKLGLSPIEHQCKEELIETIGTFRRRYKGLANLAKFTPKDVLDTIEKGLI